VKGQNLETGDFMRIHLGGNIYGCGNIGDDAILAGLLKIIRSAAPDAELTVATYEAKSLSFLPPGTRTVSSYDENAVAKSIARCDVFISGGGTMIGDELGANFPLIHNLKRVAEAKRLGKGAIMLAIGANRLKTEQGLKLAAMLAQCCDLITVRDQASQDVCLSLGLAEERVLKTADPAFLLEATPTARSEKIKARIGENGKTLGVNVVNEAWADRADYKKAIAAFCDAMNEQQELTPVFFCNEVRQGEKYDQAANKQTAEFITGRRVFLEPDYLSPGEMIDVISAFDAVFTMRMHGLIFSALAGRPFAAISRVDKVDNFMRLFDMKPSGTIEDIQAERIVEDLVQAMGKWPGRESQNAQRLEKLAASAKENSVILTSALSDHRNSKKTQCPEAFEFRLRRPGIGERVRAFAGRFTRDKGL
jgi:polysaccharide pyruvyl transferase WcaK-like protein